MCTGTSRKYAEKQVSISNGDNCASDIAGILLRSMTPRSIESLLLAPTNARERMKASFLRSLLIAGASSSDGRPGDRKNGGTEFFDGSTYGAALPIRRRLSTASYNSRQILVEPQIY